MIGDWDSLVKNWFQAKGGAGLVLPDGWFGRPYDNIHRLSFLAIRPLWLVLELDEHLLLSIRQPTSVRCYDDELVISGFSSCIVDRKEFGSDVFHVEMYDSGEVRLVAPPGCPTQKPHPE